MTLKHDKRWLWWRHHSPPHPIGQIPGHISSDHATDHEQRCCQRPKKHNHILINRRLNLCWQRGIQRGVWLISNASIGHNNCRGRLTITVRGVVKLTNQLQRKRNKMYKITANFKKKLAKYLNHLINYQQTASDRFNPLQVIYLQRNVKWAHIFVTASKEVNKICLNNPVGHLIFWTIWHLINDPQVMWHAWWRQ